MSPQKNEIHQGDCVGLLDQVQPASIDLVFADPPFNIGYDYDVYDDTRASDDYLKWSRSWISGVFQALKPDGTFWLAIGDEYAAELKIEAQRVGFQCRSWVIWYYTFGVNCVNGFSRSHTHLFHFVKDPKQFTFNRNNPEIRVKSARELVYADQRANPNGRLPDNTWITRPQDGPDFLSFNPNHDTWYFARVAGTFKEREGFHGCQMPEQLLARIIRTSSKPQEVVLDPFAGSGTTLCVAKKLARQWMGFEISTDYVEFIRERLEQSHPGDAIDGPDDPIRSAPKTADGKQRKKPFNEATQQIVIEAYQKAGEGYPADLLLCDQSMNAHFI
ncbi:MAG: site-specific DNA-methyltransferase, partial [Planctomycetota bacterium]